MGQGNGSVVIDQAELVALRHGVGQLKGMIKSARRCDAALERDSADLDALEDARTEIQSWVDSQDEEGGAPFRLGRQYVTAGRIAARLRHGAIHKSVATAEQLEIAHDDMRVDLTVVETLGRKLGVQLDAIDHGMPGEEGED